MQYLNITLCCSAEVSVRLSMVLLLDFTNVRFQDISDICCNLDDIGLMVHVSFVYHI